MLDAMSLSNMLFIIHVCWACFTEKCIADLRGQTQCPRCKMATLLPSGVCSACGNGEVEVAKVNPMPRPSTETAGASVHVPGITDRPKGKEPASEDFLQRKVDEEVQTREEKIKKQMKGEFRKSMEMKMAKEREEFLIQQGKSAMEMEALRREVAIQKLKNQLSE
ncbi:uncharacterized protein [Haliotis cracherodii]|uniref:uncharacterized protein isoform X2 n=1 Tax=Haliotis cracherodii TaxID=6455 RepID=UPI0039ECF4A2